MPLPRRTQPLLRRRRRLLDHLPAHSHGFLEAPQVERTPSPLRHNHVGTRLRPSQRYRATRNWRVDTTMGRTRIGSLDAVASRTSSNSLECGKKGSRRIMTKLALRQDVQASASPPEALRSASRKKERMALQSRRRLPVEQRPSTPTLRPAPLLGFQPLRPTRLHQWTGSSGSN